MIAQATKFLLKAPVHVYRWTFKPLVGHHCRHWPSCSQYALDAIETNGAWRGFWLMVSRVVRCGPGGTHGVDPVPDIRCEHHALAPWRYGRWTAASSTALADQATGTTQTIKIIASADGTRRVSIIRHPSGLYGFDEEVLRDEEGLYPGAPRVSSWCPVTADSFAMCDTAGTAEREARARVSWLNAA